MLNTDHVKLEQKWAPVLEGVEDAYVRRMTAQLLENQAKHILHEREQALNEYQSGGTTTVGQLGTFQKFAFPLVRRVFPELIFNKIGAVQPMNGPVSQIFYLGSNRVYGATPTTQSLYSKYQMTYLGYTTSAIGTRTRPIGGAGFGDETGGSGLDLDISGTFPLWSVFSGTDGGASTTYGGQIAMWPDTSTTLGWFVSAGESLAGTSIPELQFKIEQQPVIARTRKMRALWTLEAAQDLRAYHDLDLERELTELLSKEVQLEIDRELIEDLRHIAYDPNSANPYLTGGWDARELDFANSNNFGPVPRGPMTTGDPLNTPTITPANWQYDFASITNPSGTQSNVWAIDFTSTSLPFAPRHVGDVYANLLAVINLASQDIYKTTHRGPGSWLICSPLVASLLESSSKLQGGIEGGDGPSNITANSISYRGKFMNKYDLFVDPLYPEDEILMGYKGSNAMDGGFVYCPYIPLQQLPTITDPESFQPRKGILTRYGKAAVTPQSRFYRIIRIVGPASNYLFQPFGRNNGSQSNAVI